MRDTVLGAAQNGGGPAMEGGSAPPPRPPTGEEAKPASAEEGAKAKGSLLAYLWGSAPASQPESVAFLRFPFLVVFPAVVVAAVILRLWDPGGPPATVAWVFLIAVGIAAARTLVAVGSMASRRPMVPESHPGHRIYRMWIVSAAFLSCLAFLALVLVLVLLSAGPEVVVPTIEIGLLSVTIGFLGLFTRYTARSFSLDIAQLGTEMLRASDTAARSYASASHELAQAYEQNTSRLLTKMDEQGEKQANILAGLTEVITKVLEALKKEVQIAEEARELGKKAVELQEAAEKSRAAAEAARKEASQRREEEERQRIVPRLGLRLIVEGVLLHHVKVRIWNGGMNGQNLEVALTPEGGVPQLMPGGDISAQQTVTLDFGDVKQYPHQSAFFVACRVADIVGRKYRYLARFEYFRATGWFDVTTGWEIRPNEFVFPDPEPVA